METLRGEKKDLHINKIFSILIFLIRISFAALKRESFHIKPIKKKIITSSVDYI